MKSPRLFLLFLAVTFFVLTIQNALARDIYVDADNSDDADGYSWTTAFPNLQSAINDALSGDIIKVTAGTYTPGLNRTDSFVLKTDVRILGGYPLGGLGIRDWHANPTILSGNIDDQNTDSDNSYHVISAENISNALLDGFIISGGNADNTTPYNNAGGGLFVINNTDLTIQNCIFRDNGALDYGGAIFSLNSSGVRTINITFMNNSSVDYGGAVYVNSGNFTLTSCKFYSNSAVNGGALATEISGDVTVENSLFSGNDATDGGALFCGTDSELLVRNSTLSGNIAVVGGGAIYGENQAEVTVVNSNLWGNLVGSGPYLSQPLMVDAASLTVGFSNVQGGEAAIFSANGANVNWNPNTNINQDPLFIDENGADDQSGNNDDNLRLASGSPCIDAGFNDFFVLKDLDGHKRFTDDPQVPDTGSGIGAKIDMGCYERLQPIYVNASATGLNDGSSWTNAFTFLQDALAVAETANWRDVIWVAAGTYRPDQGSASYIIEGDRFNYFNLRNVEIYGGFAGNEASLESRNWQVNSTTLSGELASSSTYDNSCRVVYIMQQALESLVVNPAVIFDGFTITGGFADDWDDAGDTCKNGAGLFIDQANPTITNCIFRKNYAIGYGAGIYNSFARPQIINCVFNNNDVSENRYSASGYVFGSGGAIANFTSYPTITNSTFVNNRADILGGGIYTHSGLATVTNSIFWKNDDGNGQGEGGQISGNATVSYSFIYGLDSLAGNQNVSGRPRFVDEDGVDNIIGTADDNLRLAANSICVDAGNNLAVPADILDLDGDGDQAEPWPMDLDAATRFYDVAAAPDTGNGTAPIVDMGAYESDGLFVSPPIDIFVDDDATGLEHGTQSQPFSTIQQAIDMACSGDDIQVFSGTYEGVGNRDLSIPGDIDISLQSLDGPDTTIIDCESLSRGITVNSGDAEAVISGFTIQNGLANWGAGIYIRSREHYTPIDNCKFIDNYANNGGGAVGIYDSVVSLFYCTFSGNHAHQNGGAVHTEQGSANVDYGIFSNNRSIKNIDSDYGSGGAIYAHQNSYVYIKHSTLSMNSAEASGGAIATEDNTFPTIISSNLNQNTATEHGGAVSVGYFPVGNKLSVNTIFSENSSSIAGGAVYCDNSGGPAIENTLFLSNDAPAGGAIYLNATPLADIVNVTLYKNTYENSGASMSLDNSEVRVENSIIWGGPLVGDSSVGVAVSNGSTLSQSYSSISSVSLGEDGSSFSTGSGNIYQDPLLTDDGHLSAASPCIDAGNNDLLPQDLLDFDFDFDWSEPIPYDLDRSPRQFDAPYTVDTGIGTPPIVDMGCYEFGLTTQDQDVDGMDDDWEVDNFGSTSVSNGQGDADSDGLSDLDEFQNSTDPNEKDSDADGMDDLWEVENDLDPLVDDAALDADGDGYSNLRERLGDTDPQDENATPPPLVIYVDDDALPNGNGSQAYPFTAIQLGLDLAVDDDTVEVADGVYIGVDNRDLNFNGKAITVRSENGYENSIIDCQADASNPYRAFLFDSGETNDSVVDGFTIENGHKWDGGAIHCQDNSSPTIKNCLFYNNYSSDDGGAVFVSSNSSPHVIACLFQENEANDNGGGMHCHTSDAVIESCSFDNNLAHSLGGGLAIVAGSNLTIISCLFNENHAADDAGGIFSEDSNNTVINTIFSGNSAVDKAGGFYSRIDDITYLVNCTFNGNSAGYGGALYSYYGSPTVVNSILWGNVSPNGNEIGLHSHCNMLVRYSNIEGGDAIFDLDGTSLFTYGLGNIDEDPLFVAPYDGSSVTNLHLQELSPCVDVGDNSMIYGLTDYDGEERIHDGDDDLAAIVDMGADEFILGGLLAKYFLLMENSVTPVKTVIEERIHHGCDDACGDEVIYQGICTPAEEVPVAWWCGSAVIDSFRVEWTGYIKAPLSGDYRFASPTWVDGDIFVKIGGEIIADQSFFGSSGFNSVVHNVKAGSLLPVEMSYSSFGHYFPYMSLWWSQPGSTFSGIPTANMIPTASVDYGPGDFDEDCDVDGYDLSDVSQVLETGLTDFAANFGRANCQ